MRLLYLLRHGHAENHSAHGDHGRELTAQGRAAAGAAGATLATWAEFPSRIVHSDATRVVQTVQALCTQAGPALEHAERTASPRLYAASADDMLDVLLGQPDGAACMLLAGHNPGISDLAARLATRSARSVRFGFRPATLVGLRFEADQWSALAEGSGDLVHMFEAGSA